MFRRRARPTPRGCRGPGGGGCAGRCGRAAPVVDVQEAEIGEDAHIVHLSASFHGAAERLPRQVCLQGTCLGVQVGADGLFLCVVDAADVARHYGCDEFCLDGFFGYHVDAVMLSQPKVAGKGWGRKDNAASLRWCVERAALLIEVRNGLSCLEHPTEVYTV